MRLDRLLANLGYGSRREVAEFFSSGRVTRADGRVVSSETERAAHAELRVDGEPLDPPAPLTLVMHKPVGVVCSHDDDEGALVYGLLPPRFGRRNPALSTVGRLDKETSGLLLLTDDGGLLHRLISPKKAVWKTYEATLARPLRGDEAHLFASGTLMLENDKKPCLPARLEVVSPQVARLSIVEGRYHQVRRMFAAVGNHVESLHRLSVGALALGDLAPGEWRPATPDDLAVVENRAPSNSP
jgi:16S rRNA pseudouridine516 synthase